MGVVQYLEAVDGSLLGDHIAILGRELNEYCDEPEEESHDLHSV